MSTGGGGFVEVSTSSGGGVEKPIAWVGRSERPDKSINGNLLLIFQVELFANGLHQPCHGGHGLHSEFHLCRIAVLVVYDHEDALRRRHRSG